MSHWDKVVKLACKPKSAAPKAKYLDPIIAATYSDESSLRDVFASLAVRLREPTLVVVHKALLVIHTMIRTGHTDNVLGFLSSSSNDVLKLRHIYDGNFVTGHVASYAAYLDARIRAFRDLRHDTIRIQNESNREDRMSGGGDGGRPSNASSSAPRAKKLRQLTVEKVYCEKLGAFNDRLMRYFNFFMDNLEDELTITTLRLLVKDLLILFQAGNEGVINVLEHYFEMSKVDAEQSLGIYKSFCTQTEGVVEYLSIARKLANLLNVPVPNLRHAPTRLAGALEEYLQDPNFEQNRIEYKTNKALADGKIPNKAKPQTQKEQATTSAPKQPEASTSKEKPRPASLQPAIDLLQSIEESQPTMFNPQTDSHSPTWFQQQHAQAAYNPFRQSTMMPQMTGMPAQQPFMMAQPTGFQANSSPFSQPAMQPQMTGMPFQSTTNPFPQVSNSPFAQPMPQMGMQTGVPFQQPFQTPMVQPQPTGFLVPQTTGTNPFRQSILMPQATGLPTASNAFPFANGQPRSASALNFSPPSAPQSAAGSQQTNSQSPFAAALINRPASTPITSKEPALKPVVSHQTGSRNPFGQPKAPSPPPVPKPPTLGELSFGAFGTQQPMQTGAFGGMQPMQTGAFNSQPQQLNATPQQPFSTQLSNALGGSTNPTTSNMSSVASAFALSDPNKPDAAASSTPSQIVPNLTAQTTSTTALSDSFSNLSFAPSTATSNTTPSIITTAPFSPLQPQATGFAGIKPFKPTSSFGASLLESLPSSTTTSAAPSAATSPITGPGSTATGTSGSQLSLPSFTLPGGSSPTSTTPGASGALNSQPTGISAFSSSLNATGTTTGASLFGVNGSTPGATSTVGVGLRPQMTGGGGINPFRVSMAGGSQFGTGAQQPPMPSLAPNMTGFTGMQQGSSMGSNLFSGASSGFKPTLATIPSFTGAFPNTNLQAGQQQQQQQQHASLI
ncbi:hypothetical protein PIIN_01309 [Serendipita indica DSM 11827]|uniref:ENTH domain-containing protein n=1 Tax=Serendipita indica (strain DSM 11827) TaxID=1109443 RepID=G4T845_SERID|nr:hypothetical protein PIIN_01309 [Serendipita indica DSM 11827]